MLVQLAPRTLNRLNPIDSFTSTVYKVYLANPLLGRYIAGDPVDSCVEA
jgi:hypothetical protein